MLFSSPDKIKLYRILLDRLDDTISDVKETFDEINGGIEEIINQKYKTMKKKTSTKTTTKTRKAPKLSAKTKAKNEAIGSSIKKYSKPAGKGGRL